MYCDRVNEALSGNQTREGDIVVLFEKRVSEVSGAETLAG